MEKRYDVSILVSNGKGCGYIESETFIGKEYRDVMEYVSSFRKSHEGLSLKVSIFEGSGFNQKKIREWYF